MSTYAANFLDFSCRSSKVNSSLLFILVCALNIVHIKMITPESIVLQEKQEVVQVILIIDLGSSSIRCTPYLYPSIEVITSASVKANVAIISPEFSRKRLDIDSVCDCIDDLVLKSTNLLRLHCKCFRIVAIGFSTMSMCIFGVDENNVPVTSLLSYACTETSSPALQRAVASLRSCSEHNLHHHETGTVLYHPAYAPAQMLAISIRNTRSVLDHKLPTTNDNNNDNDNENRIVSNWQTISQRVIDRWCGDTSARIPMMSVCEASWTGLLSFRTSEWNLRAIELSAIDKDTLPRLCHFDEFHGSFNFCMTNVSIHELQGAKLFLGVGDGACAAVGSRCTNQNRVSVTIGTSAAVRVIVDLPCDKHLQFRVPPGLWCYRISRQQCLVGGALNDGGNLIHWFSGILGGTRKLNRAQQYLERLYSCPKRFLKRNRNVTEFPVILPFWTGERSTGWRSSARGSIRGLSRETSSVDLLFSLMESVCWRLVSILEVMKKEGIIGSVGSSSSSSSSSIHKSDNNDSIVLAVSGAALETNHVWRQMLADISQCTVNWQPASELTSIGAALLVAHRLENEHVSSKQVLDGDVSKHYASFLVQPTCDPYMKKFYQRRRKLHNIAYSKDY